MRLGTAFAGFVLLAQAAAAAETFAVPKEIAPSNSEESSWSPDGTRIAFDSARDGKFFNVYSLELSTGRVTRLTRTRANDITPAWSPDGRRIAFTSDRTGDNEIWVMNANGSAARRVTRDRSDSIHPFWSPDGKTLIYCSARNNPDRAHAPEGEVYEIYTIRPDGSRRRKLTSLGGINTYPNFSPDGKRIVFRKVLGERNSEIWVMEENGREPKNLSEHPAFDAWPHWSPDGRRIVFASNRRTNGEDYDLYVMNSDGSGLRRLTDIPGRNTSPKWSPDGTRITFDQSAGGRVRILMMQVP